MTNSADGAEPIMSVRDPTAVPRWAAIMFGIAAALQAIEGFNAFPGIVGIVLVALAGAALYFIAMGPARYALFAMSALLLAAWLDLVTSANADTADPATLWLFVLLPVIALTVAFFAWRATRLTFATVLASLPTIVPIVAAFVLGLVSS